MIGLASALAKQLVTTSDDSIERLERFAFALDYSIGLLAVSDPGRWPNGALQKTVLGGTTSLKNLYFTPPAADEGASWKLLHDHDMASGHYKIYFDVPASIPPQPNVILDVKRVEALDPESNGADMRVTVGIGFSAEATRTLARNKNVHEPRWSVQRKVNRAVEAFIRVEELVEGPAWGEVELANGTYEPCGESHPSGSYPPCPGTWQHLATDPSGSGSVDLWIDVESGAISGDVNGQAGKSLTVQGLHGARARVTFVPRVVTP